VITSSGSKASFQATAIDAWGGACAGKGSWSRQEDPPAAEAIPAIPIRWQSFKISTTDSNHGHRVYPNLLAETTLTGINQAWVADITYFRLLKGFIFLAAILDRYSRKVIGWAISKCIDAELCLAALKSALQTRQPPPGCIHDSDRGVQYACGEYIALLEQAQIQISMSRTGNPYDNAHMESFFKTLKYHYLHSPYQRTWPSQSFGPFNPPGLIAWSAVKSI